MKIVIFSWLAIISTIQCHDETSYSLKQFDESAFVVTRASTDIQQVINNIMRDANAATDNRPIFYAYNILVDSITSLIEHCSQIEQLDAIYEEVIFAVEPRNTRISAQIYCSDQETVLIDGNKHILPACTGESCYLVVSVSKAALEYLMIDELRYLIARELYSFVHSCSLKQWVAPTIMASFIALSSFAWGADVQWSASLSLITGVLSYCISGQQYVEMDKDSFALKLLGNKSTLRLLLSKQIYSLAHDRENWGEVQMLRERLDVL